MEHTLARRASRRWRCPCTLLHGDLSRQDVTLGSEIICYFCVNVIAMEENNSVRLDSSYSDGRWMTFNYDLGYGYGYDSIIRVFDTLVERGELTVDIVRKGKMADSPYEMVWQREAPGSAPRLSDMPALAEECGLVAVGGESQTLGGCVVHIVMYNQSSGLRIETPEQLYLERIRSHDPFDRMAAIFQETLLTERNSE